MTGRCAARPDCSVPGHGFMALREHPDLLAASLGTWYDCTAFVAARKCLNSVLLPHSDEATR